MSVDVEIFDFANPTTRESVEAVIDLYYDLDSNQVPYLIEMGELDSSFVVDKIEFEDFVDRFFGAPNTAIALMRYDGRPCGFCWYTASKEFAHISSFFVAEEYRNKGLGLRLMAQVLGVIKPINDSISLDVLPVNTRAQSFYARFGFYPSSMTMTRRTP